MPSGAAACGIRGNARTAPTASSPSRRRSIKRGTKLRSERQDSMTERWSAIPGRLWHYEVSDAGRVRNVRTGKILKPTLVGKQDRRYFRVSLGARNNHRLNRIVLSAFVGPPPTMSHQAAHLNGDRLDNRLSNLTWVTQTENFSHKRLHGTALVGEKNHQAILTADGVADMMQRLAAGESYRGVARRLGVTDRTVRRIASGETWRCKHPRPPRGAGRGAVSERRAGHARLIVVDGQIVEELTPAAQAVLDAAVTWAAYYDYRDELTG
jgi:hypothetical protein